MTQYLTENSYIPSFSEFIYENEEIDMDVEDMEMDEEILGEIQDIIDENLNYMVESIASDMIFGEGELYEQRGRKPNKENRMKIAAKTALTSELRKDEDYQKFAQKFAKLLTRKLAKIWRGLVKTSDAETSKALRQHGRDMARSVIYAHTGIKGGAQQKARKKRAAENTRVRNQKKANAQARRDRGEKVRGRTPKK